MNARERAIEIMFDAWGNGIHRDFFLASIESDSKVGRDLRRALGKIEEQIFADRQEQLAFLQGREVTKALGLEPPK